MKSISYTLFVILIIGLSSVTIAENSSLDVLGVQHKKLVKNVSAQALVDKNTAGKLVKILNPFKNLFQVKFKYSEERVSLFFKKPQIVLGEMEIKQSNFIIKEQLHPLYKKYTINNNNLLIQNTGDTSKQTQVDIRDYPKLTQMINLIQALFSANNQFINNFYKVDINNTKKPWMLTLTPKEMFDIESEEYSMPSIKTIKIKGYHDELLSIQTIGFSGESSTLLVKKILEKNNNHIQASK